MTGYTPFSQGNKAFSDKAHLAARRLIYPALFKTDQSKLAYEDQEAITTARGGALDGDMSIDRIVKVTVNSFRHPMTFTFQERFRKPDNAWRQDITITEWNNATNLPSEFYKISANMFLYAYYNEQQNSFADAICVNVPAMMLGFALGTLKHDRSQNPRSNQPFVTVRFSELYEQRLVVYHMKAKQENVADRIRAVFKRLTVFEQLRLISDLTGDMAQSAKTQKKEVA